MKRILTKDAYFGRMEQYGNRINELKAELIVATTPAAKSFIQNKINSQLAFIFDLERNYYVFDGRYYRYVKKYCKVLTF